MHARTATQKAITGYFLVICASFLVLMNVVCMVLKPQLFRHPHWGISYFGSQRITVLPYYVGFLIILGCLARVTYLLWPTVGKWRPLRLVFLVATVLAGCIAATSAMSNSFLYWTHIYACLALLLVVMAAEMWALLQSGTGAWDYAGMALLVAGAVVVNLSGDWIGALGLYAWGEMLWFLGAFLCLARAALRATV